MAIDTSNRAGIQRSIRHCLSNVAALLYQHGHVLETVTISHRGLDRDALRQLQTESRDWNTCQRVLESSEAATYNRYGRFILTPMGRDLLFDMFGEGAADCA